MFSGWIILIVCCACLLMATLGGLLYKLCKIKYQRKEDFVSESRQITTQTSPRLRGFLSKRTSEDKHKLEKGNWLPLRASVWRGGGSSCPLGRPWLGFETYLRKIQSLTRPSLFVNLVLVILTICSC